MQQTTQAWKEIVATEGHRFETRVILDGNTLTQEKIRLVSRDRPGMDGEKPTIGGALISTLRLVISEMEFEIPKRAEITIEARARVNNRTSGWIKQGTYFVNTRTTDEGNINLLEIEAVDAMAYAEADYPDTTHDWPWPDIEVVREIAAEIGVEVEPRTEELMTAHYMVNLPASYTMRETLGHIAASYCGNFIITAENKLLLVPLYGLNPEVTGFYLAAEKSATLGPGGEIVEDGTALVFGNEGWFILV